MTRRTVRLCWFKHSQNAAHQLEITESELSVCRLTAQELELDFASGVSLGRGVCPVRDQVGAQLGRGPGLRHGEARWSGLSDPATSTVSSQSSKSGNEAQSVSRAPAGCPRSPGGTEPVAWLGIPPGAPFCLKFRLGQPSSTCPKPAPSPPALPAAP